MRWWVPLGSDHWLRHPLPPQNSNTRQGLFRFLTVPWFASVRLLQRSGRHPKSEGCQDPRSTKKSHGCLRTERHAVGMIDVAKVRMDGLGFNQSAIDVETELGIVPVHHHGQIVPLVKLHIGFHAVVE